MMIKSMMMLTTTLLLLAACGPGSSDAPPVVAVPSQPPPPPSIPSSSSSVPPAASSASTSAPVAVKPWKCEGAGAQPFEIGGRSYCGYAEPETWEASEQRCVENGGHLITLDTAARSESVRRELGSPIGKSMGRAAWIGVEKEKKGQGGKWRWINGTEITAANANWNTNEPNNFDGNEGCGEWLAVDGRWNDTRCDLKQAFICQESKPDKPLECTKGGAKAFVAKGVRYCLNPAEKSFPDAKKACESSGGSLAIFKSKEESAAMKEALAQRFAAKRMWIGATDSADEGVWTWTSGAKLEWDHWLPGEPNNFNREDCAELHVAEWMWNDMDCAMKLPSVCESVKK